MKEGACLTDNVHISCLRTMWLSVVSLKTSLKNRYRPLLRVSPLHARALPGVRSQWVGGGWRGSQLCPQKRLGNWPEESPWRELKLAVTAHPHCRGTLTNTILNQVFYLC